MQGLEHEEVVRRVRWAMEIVGLDFEAFKDRLTFSLSGGERRKLALASTLVLQTPVLLLDEPTAGLDPSSRKEIIQHLRHMQQDGRTLLQSTHDLNDVAALTENTTIMDGGKSGFFGLDTPGILDARNGERCGIGHTCRSTGCPGDANRRLAVTRGNCDDIRAGVLPGSQWE